MSKTLSSADVSKAYADAKDEKGKDAVAKQAFATIEDHEKGHIDKDKVIADGKEAADAAAKEIKSLTDKLSVSEGDLLEATNTIADLGQQLDVQSKAPNAIVQVAHKGKTYQVVGKSFVTQNGEVKAEDLAKNKALIADLVERGSGILQEVTK